MNIENIIEEIFEVLQKIVRSNHNMETLLNNDYKQALTSYLKIIPENKLQTLCKSYMVFKEYLTCIDFNKLIEKINNSNIPSFQINSKQILCSFIMSKIESINKQDKKFVEKLLERLDNLFTVVDYIIKNPKEIAANANVFVSIEDNVFS